jgi:hypothetical protein
MTSGLSQHTIMAIRQSEANSKIVCVSEVETEHAKILPTFNDMMFCDQLISSVNIATLYSDDMDGIMEDGKQQQVSSIITNDRHSKVMPEFLVQKWNICIDTAKQTALHYKRI